MHIEDMKISEKARARRNATLKDSYERELANIKGMKESVAQFEKEREILLTKRDEIFNRELNVRTWGDLLEYRYAASHWRATNSMSCKNHSTARSVRSLTL